MDNEDQEFFFEIKEQIDRMTDVEVKALAEKTPSMGIDVPAIRDKNERVYFETMKVQMEDAAYQFLPFFDQLREDSPVLFDKLSVALDPEELSHELAACKTLTEIKEACRSEPAPEVLNEIRKFGEAWFKEQQYEKAQLYFLYLTAVENSNPKNWIAKGITEQNIGLYQEALESFFFAISLSPSHLIPYLQVIECLILSDKYDEARQFLEALEREVNTQDYGKNPLYSSKIEKIRRHLQRAA